MMIGMTRSRMGRPSKGDRRVLYSRPPAVVAERVEQEAARTGLPMSDVVANILAAHYGLPPVAEAPHADQQKLIA